MVGRHDSAAGAPQQPREMTQPQEMTHPHTKVVLQSRQFSSSSSPDTPRTKVVLRQLSASNSPDTPRTLPATTSAHGGSQSAVPATTSAHGGSQSAVLATKSALQETSETSNHNGGTIPSMIRP